MSGNAIESFAEKYGDATVYISGPMSNRPEMNKVLFDAVERALADAGCKDVINPARLIGSVESWSEAMRIDLRDLLRADVMVRLPDWYESRGAVLESRVAESIGVKIVQWGD